MTFSARSSVLLVINPIAGQRRRGLVDGVVAHLRRNGISVEIVETAAPGDARRLAETCDGRRYGVLAIAGGDGTVNEAVNGLAGRSGIVPAPLLAIVPLGTANVLAHELGLGSSPGAVAQTIRAGRALPLHPGEARTGDESAPRRFTLMAGAGFDAWVVAGVSPGLKRRWGKLAYVWRSVVETWRYRPARYAVDVDGSRHVAASVVVTHARHYAGPWIIAPAAALDRDSLEVCLFERWGRLSVLRFGLALLTGRLPRTSGFRTVTGRSIRISLLDAEREQPRRRPVQVDGDAALSLPLSIALSPETVRLLRPA